VRILVVAATSPEIAPLVATFGAAAAGGDRLPRISRYFQPPHSIDVLQAGVGMVPTAVWCGRALEHGGYDLALNLGVCGSFEPSLAPGTVVHVVSEQMTELGAEDGGAFITMQELGLMPPDEPPFAGGRLVNQHPPSNRVVDALPAVRGITVNTVHGDPRSIEAVVGRVAPQVESMEGAAFMYACLVRGVCFAEVRAVSNIVERRDRSRWKMREAVERLCATARELIDVL
jgi:futalosine hydrolase